MKNKIFLFLFSSFSFASDIVYDPYGDLNTTTDDTSFDIYLNYVTDSLIRKQEVRDRLQELQKPKDTIVLDDMVGTITKTTYDIDDIPTTTTSSNLVVTDDYRYSGILSSINNFPLDFAYGWFNPLTSVYSTTVGTDFEYNYNSHYILQEQILNQINAHTGVGNGFLEAITFVNDSSLSLQRNDFKLQVDSLNEIFKQTNALNEIKAQIQSSNVLFASGNSKLDSIATMECPL